MALTVNTNLASIQAQRSLSRLTDQLGQSFRRLSTGLRIASAADDAAGLAISERLRAQVRSLDQARRNANDGISMVQTAEGALDESGNLLIRLRELAVQASNGSVSAADRDTLQQEFGDLVDEIDRIAQSTEFNDIKLLDGSQAAVSFHVGIGTTAGVDTLSVSLDSARSADLGIDTLDIGSTGDPLAAIDALDDAIDDVSGLRGRLGATQNRLGSTIANLAVQSENLTAAESRIRDVDVAYETAQLTRLQILQQAAVSVLGQSNALPQAALRLLG
ncbi:MAG: flagellin FliC [Planctomycetes bacterium]|nr:flagellin FliC [Planctomycetota bacterium]